MPRSPQPGPAQEYELYGNARPLAGMLRLIDGAVERTDSGILQLLRVDVCIDLAMADSGNASEHLERADRALARYVSHAEFLEREGSAHDARPHLAPLAYAYIRSAQMEAWGDAAHDEPPEHDYEELLSGLSDAVSLASLHEQTPSEVESAVREALPVLLGSRGLARGSGGWLGRTALHREKRNISNDDRRQRWTTGFCIGDTAQEFDHPGVVAEVRASAAQKDTPKPDVMRINARRFGLANPAPIVWSCILEQDRRVPDQIDTGSLLNSNQLDRITELLWGAVETYNNTGSLRSLPESHRFTF